MTRIYLKTSFPFRKCGYEDCKNAMDVTADGLDFCNECYEEYKENKITPKNMKTEKATVTYLCPSLLTKDKDHKKWCDNHSICKEPVEWSFADVADKGEPICGGCDADMMQQKECGNCGRPATVSLGEDMNRCERCTNL